MTEAALRAPEARLVHALGRLRAAAWLGDPEQVRRIGAQAQSRWPNDARVLYWKGVGLHHTGDVEGGVVALKQAAAMDPEEGSTWNELAEALRLSGRLDEALDAARKARELDTDPARTAIALGLVLRDRGELPAAREAFLQATPDPHYGPSAHMQLGGLERQVGDMKKAAAHFSEALRINPHHPTARHGLAVVHAMDSNNGQAEIEVRRHLEDWPEDGTAWNTLGRVLGMEDRWAEAVDAFDRGASVADNRLDLLFDLCNILDTADRGREIPAALERLNLDKAPRTDPSTLEQMALLAQKHDALEAAAALWQAYITHPKAAPDAGAFEHAARATLRLAARATDEKTRDRLSDRALRILNDALTTLRSRPLTDDDRTRLRRWTDDDPDLFPLRDSPPWNTLRSEFDALLDSR
jgi:tetratricopeptide (TPR) repeat protein